MDTTGNDRNLPEMVVPGNDKFVDALKDGNSDLRKIRRLEGGNCGF